MFIFDLPTEKAIPLAGFSSTRHISNGGAFGLPKAVLLM
jgi:hypothetical protein